MAIVRLSGEEGGFSFFLKDAWARCEIQMASQ